MAVIVEDGTIVAGATSYNTEDELNAYAKSIGVVLVKNKTILLVESFNFINGLETKLKGDMVSRDQAGAYPRSGLTIEDWTWGSDEIPRQVLTLQLLLCIESDSGDDLYNDTLNNLPVVSKTVGPIERKFASPNGQVKVNKTRPSSVYINMLTKGGGFKVFTS